MSKMADVAYDPLTSGEETKEGAPSRGGQGKDLLPLKDPIRWYLVVISAFALASIGVVGWVATGPSLNAGHRVLRTGTLKVDQFYSGLALSLFLAPAAIIVRWTAHDLALLQPFRISSRKPVSLADLDLLMEPGILAMVKLAKYSATSAAVLALLLFAGAFLFPIGALLITTTNYAAPSIGEAVIGIPSTATGARTLQIDMKMTFSNYCTPFW
jgi:hypothetical protein